MDFDAAYASLPAFDAPDGAPSPAAPSPAAPPLPTDDALDAEDDGSLDLSGPDAESGGADEEAAVAADGSDDEEADPEDDRDWLIERAQKADEYERFLAQQQSARQEQEAVAYWDQRLTEANNFFASEEAVIYENARNNLNPVEFLQAEITKLNNRANAWYAQYRDNREQALWQFAHQAAIPQHAARVVEHYKLPQEAVDELLDYPPEQMEREAQKMRARLIKERKAQRTIDQLKRKEAARKIAASTVAPGSGRAAGRGGAEPSFEEAYASIPWTRGR